MVWALVPAKLGADAKRRLTRVLGPEQRTHLAYAMLRDVLTALRGATSLAGVAVIGRGRVLGDLADELGITSLGERRAQTLNEAVTEGVAVCRARGAAAVLVAMGDLPLLRSDDVDRLVAAVPDRGIAVAPSLDGTGTNLLGARPPAAITPAFGPDSLASHRELASRAGFPFVTCPLPGAALDVDTPADLARLIASEGANAATRDFLLSIDATSSAPSAFRST
jgi:2-phospho-L-lactate/phosphoenolpyruvate guanylyltransferase